MLQSSKYYLLCASLFYICVLTIIEHKPLPLHVFMVETVLLKRGIKKRLNILKQIKYLEIVLLKINYPKNQKKLI